MDVALKGTETAGSGRP